MNETLKRIKQQANKEVDSKLLKKDEQRAHILRCVEAARPLFQAFEDIKGQFVKITILRQIWPTDYHQRDDHAPVLIAQVIGGDETPRGLMFHLPGGHRRFETELQPDGEMGYIVSTDMAGTRPQYITFASTEPWLDMFYKTMAHLLEL